MAGSPAPFPALFRMAVKSGSLPTVLLHIRRGLNVNAVGDRGRTPLMIAAASGRLEVCRLLLEEGAEAAARDAEGNSAVTIARSLGQHAVADLVAGYLREPAAARMLAPVVAPPLPPPETVTLQSHAPAVGQEERLAPPAGPMLDDLVTEGGWDAEPEPGPPPDHDQGRFEEALAVQGAISARTAVNGDADWSDVTVDLPRAGAGAGPSTEGSTTAGVRRLLLQAVVSGLVSSEQLADAAAPGKAGGLAPDAVTQLAAVLEDLGCELVDAPSDPWPAALLRTGEASPRDRHQARDAAAFLEDVASAGSDPLAAFEADAARRKVLRKGDQGALWKAYRQGRRDLAFALSGAPHVLDELVSRLDRLSIRRPETGPWSATDDAEDPGESEEAPVDPAGASLDVLDPQLAYDLGLAVQRARASDNPETGLADHLLELNLPVHLIDQVRRALLLDPASATACAELSVALRKIERARRTLVEAHQRFVRRIAERYDNRGLDLMDRIQEGNIGLLKAIEKFDVARGFAFTTYATWWVRQAITRAIADQGRAIRIPVHRQESISKVGRAARAFQNQYGREASAAELSALLDLPPGTVAVALSLGFEMVALEASESETGCRQLAETLVDPNATPPDEAVAAVELSQAVASVLGALSAREERIVRLRFGLNLISDQTLEEIGDPIGVTRERIRQIEHKALQRLKHPSRSRRLWAFLES